MLLQISHVTASYGKEAVLQDLSISLSEGTLTMLCGPNGAGKTTLIRALAQTIPYTGDMFYGSYNLKTLSPRSLARCLGVLSQSRVLSYSFTVEEVVRMGRYAYRRPFLAFREKKEAPAFLPSASSESDDAYVAEALSLTGLLSLRAKNVLTLSGGEQQRVFLAQLLAQSPRILLLDEPSNHLDLSFQKDLFSLLSEWKTAAPGRAVLAAVHDLSLALSYGDNAVLLSRGRAHASGEIKKTLSPQNLERVYGFDVYDTMRGLLKPFTESDG